MMFGERAWSVVAIVLLVLQGCASVTTGNRQDVQVVATAAGQNVDDADCELSNDKGRWLISTPATVEIQPSFQDLSVRCAIASHEAGTATFKSSVGAPVFGNIIAGGIVGAVIAKAGAGALAYRSDRHHHPTDAQGAIATHPPIKKVAHRLVSFWEF